MSSNLNVSLNKFAGKLAVVLPLLFAVTPSHAQDFTAGVVMKKMSAAERFTFMSGVVEGLAYARYVKDGKKTEGMGCVYDWYYKDSAVAGKIESAFERFPDYVPGAIMEAMIEKACGA